MNNSLLQDTLSTIAIEFERDGKFSQSFDLVSKLLSAYGEDNLTERLYAEIPHEYSWKVVADLFGILIWSMSVKGASALLETTENWLVEGNDLRKIQIGLHLDIYPFRNKTKMIEVLSIISDSFPILMSRCNELITERRDLEQRLKNAVFWNT